MSTGYSRLNHIDAAGLAQSIMDLSWGMQDETLHRGDDRQRKVGAALELIRHSAASLLDYLNEIESQVGAPHDIP